MKLLPLTEPTSRQIATGLERMGFSLAGRQTGL